MFTIVETTDRVVFRKLGQDAGNWSVDLGSKSAFVLIQAMEQTITRQV